MSNSCAVIYKVSFAAVWPTVFQGVLGGKGVDTEELGHARERSKVSGEMK